MIKSGQYWLEVWNLKETKSFERNQAEILVGTLFIANMHQTRRLKHQTSLKSRISTHVKVSR